MQQRCLNLKIMRTKTRLTIVLFSVYDEAMVRAEYQKLQDTALKIASTLPRPAFYGDHTTLLSLADETL